MGRRNKNTFSKALGHLKSRSIDEKLQMLSERPANSTAGYMTINPSTPNADFVSTEEGTGIVHISLTFGSDDFTASKKNEMPGVLSLIHISEPTRPY